MTILTDSPQAVNSLAHFDTVYAGMVFDEMCQIAARTYTEKVLDGIPMMPWQDFLDAYRQVWGASRNIDLSPFPAPPAPTIPDPTFEQWVTEMEAAFGDMSDAQIQQMTGIPMF